MALQKPIDPQDENIVFNREFITHADMFVKEIRTIARERSVTYPETIPVGETVVYNEVDIDFFERLLLRSILLVGRDYPGDVLQAASMMTLYDFISNYTFAYKQFEASLIDNHEADIISYRHGLPPIFHKRQYSDVLRMEIDPYQILLEHNPTSSTNFLQKVIRSYLGEI